jgi:hypothetical protein
VPRVGELCHEPASRSKNPWPVEPLFHLTGGVVFLQIGRLVARSVRYLVAQRRRERQTIAFIEVVNATAEKEKAASITLCVVRPSTTSAGGAVGWSFDVTLDRPM